MITEESLLWKRILEDKYGPNIGGLNVLGSDMCPSLSSYWWKDLWALEDPVGPNWFKLEVERKTGDGMATSFWKDR